MQLSYKSQVNNRPVPLTLSDYIVFFFFFFGGGGGGGEGVNFLKVQAKTYSVPQRHNECIVPRSSRPTAKGCRP